MKDYASVPFTCRPKGGGEPDAPFPASACTNNPCFHAKIH